MIVDCLKYDGKQPVKNGMLTILVSVSAKTGKHFLREMWEYDPGHTVCCVSG